MTYEATVEACLSNKDFMREYKRLSKASLGSGPPIISMVDKATGKTEQEAHELFEFIRDYIWLRAIDV